MDRLPDSLETDRLLLRTWTEADADSLAQAVAESLDELLAWMPWAALEPLPVADRRKLFREWDATWRDGGEVIYGVFLDGAVVGGTGLHRRAGPHDLEIGYWIHSGHTRRGYASEAARGLTDLAFSIDGIERVEIHHDQANAASRAVPAKLGYELIAEQAKEPTAPGETGVDCVWATTRDQWLASGAGG
jgi:RimJ/RimL family protein N-acetyltransferase